MDMHKNTCMYPSFATSILEEICRSMDGGNENFYNNRVVKNTSMYPPSFASGILDEICLSMDSGNEKQRQSHSVMDEDMASLRRACLLQHETTSVSKRPKPVKTTSVSKKEKQPISAGRKLASFLKSLFSNGNSKKAKNSSSSSTGGYGDAHVERKAKSTQACAFVRGNKDGINQKVLLPRSINRQLCWSCLALDRL